MSAKLQWLTVACLFGVLGFFSLDNLTESPPTWFDEGVYLQTAINDTLYGHEALRVTPDKFVSAQYVTGGYTFLKPISWVFKIFGIGILQARLVMVAFIFACVGIFFLFLRRLFGFLVALGALALLVTFPPLYGQGKNVLGEVPGLFFLGSLLYSLYWIERREYMGWQWYVLAGISAGLCMATKPIFLLLGGAVLITIALHSRSLTFRWKEILLGVLAFLIPIAVWIFIQFSPGESPIHLLGFYANSYAIADIRAQIIQNILRFFHESAPLYFLMLIGVWSLSYVLRWRLREKIALAETMALTFSLLVLAAYLRTPGWYRYYFLAEIPALAFFPSAISILLRHLPFNKINIERYGAGASVLILVLVQTYQLFFGSWVSVHSASTTTQDLKAYMATLPKDDTFFIYNSPQVAIFLPNQKYYQYYIPTPTVALGREGLSALSAGIPDIFVTVGEDKFNEFNEASSSISRYEKIETIDGVIFAGRKHQ
jgi:hypothetical protein